MVGFARAGARTFAGAAPGADTATVDLRLVAGDWYDDVPQVKGDVPDCADRLMGTPADVH